MENIQYKDFDSICRFCLKRDLFLSPIFKDSSAELYDKANEGFVRMLSICTGLEIKTGDGLPKFMCTECINHLYANYAFRNQCLVSTEYLKELLLAEQTKSLEPKRVQSNEFVILNVYVQNPNNNDIKTEVSTNSISTTEANIAKQSENETILNEAIENSMVNQINNKVIENRKVKEKSSNSRQKKNNKNLIFSEEELAIEKVRQSIKLSIKEKFAKEKLEKEIIHINNNHNELQSNTISCSVKPSTSKIISDEEKTIKEIRKSIKASINERFAKEKGEAIVSKSAKKRERKINIQICQICGALRHNLKQHMSTHSNEKLCRCDICGLSVKTREILRKHMRVHNEIRPYKCEICDVSFKTFTHRKRHMMTHTKERNFPCNFCNRPFVDAGTRDRHIIIHGQDRKVKCEHCGKLFLTAIGLKNHIGIHTGELLFKCGFCPKKFLNSSSASVHRRTHTINNKYKCGSCQMEFKYLNLFKIHLKTEKHVFKKH